MIEPTYFVTHPDGTYSAADLSAHDAKVRKDALEEASRLIAAKYTVQHGIHPDDIMECVSGLLGPEQPEQEQP